MSTVVLPERRTEDDLRGGGAMRRDRRGEDVPGGLSDERLFERGTASGEAPFWNHSQRVGKAARLVEGRGYHACGDGEHGLVLETCVQRAGRERAGLPGQPAGSEGTQGPQDRR